MKKYTMLLFSFAILSLILFAPSSAAQSEIRVFIEGEQKTFAQPPIMSNNHTLVPLRGIFESLGAEVKWNKEQQTVSATKDDIQLKLIIGSLSAQKNDTTLRLSQPVIVVRGSTMVPLRFVSEALGENVKWVQRERAVYIGAMENLPSQTKPPAVTTAEKVTVKVGNQSFAVQTVKLPQGSVPRIGLANQRIGYVSSIQQIADSNQASVAVNGTFFEAYSGTPYPWGTIIDDGQVLHIGSVGSLFGFTADGQVKMDALQVQVEGATNDSYHWPNNWYAYNFNRTPDEAGSAVIIFTPHRGAQTGLHFGTSVVVKKGIVTEIVENKNVNIPNDGYVIHFTGAEKSLADRFRIGTKVDYRAKYVQRVTHEEVNWSDIQVAIGAGPQLVKDGMIVADPAAEGYVDQKILTSSAARSAIASLHDGTIMLATVRSATIQQWAEILSALGADQAMNLDGGASSGLYYKGSMLTQPGRELSNVLLFD